MQTKDGKMAFLKVCLSKLQPVLWIITIAMAYQLLFSPSSVPFQWQDQWQGTSQVLNLKGRTAIEVQKILGQPVGGSIYKGYYEWRQGTPLGWYLIINFKKIGNGNTERSDANMVSNHAYAIKPLLKGQRQFDIKYDLW